MPHEITQGGSCIVNLLGQFIADPVFGKEEILYATLDLDDIKRRNFDFDAVGHYNRKDIFQLISDFRKV